MIKGVNKCILEVAGGGSKYFEKAILFVKPEYAGAFSAKLQNDAKIYLNSLDHDPSLPEFRPAPRSAVHRRRRIIQKILLGAIFLAGMIGYTVFIKSLQ